MFKNSLKKNIGIATIFVLVACGESEAERTNKALQLQQQRMLAEQRRMQEESFKRQEEFLRQQRELAIDAELAARQRAIERENNAMDRLIIRELMRD